MYIDSSARSRDVAISVGSSDLSEGLMLLRASTLKIIRLQLAIERHDRQAALATVDDLIMLDRRLQSCFDGVPATGEQLMLRRELDCERTARNQEKLTLAAEILRRPASCVEQVQRVDPPASIEQGDDGLGPPNLRFEQEERGRSRWWLAIVPILVSAMAAGAYFVSAPDGAAWLTEATRALR